MPPLCRGCGCRTGPYTVGKVVKVIRERGRLVPVAWVRCRRPIPGLAEHCGWSWWSTHPDLVQRAKRQKGFKLVRARKARAVARQDRKGARRHGR